MSTAGGAAAAALSSRSGSGGQPVPPDWLITAAEWLMSAWLVLTAIVIISEIFIRWRKRRKAAAQDLALQKEHTNAVR